MASSNEIIGDAAKIISIIENILEHNISYEMIVYGCSGIGKMTAVRYAINCAKVNGHTCEDDIGYFKHNCRISDIVTFASSLPKGSSRVIVYHIQGIKQYFKLLDALHGLISIILICVFDTDEHFNYGFHVKRLTDKKMVDVLVNMKYGNLPVHTLNAIVSIARGSIENAISLIDSVDVIDNIKLSIQGRYCKHVDYDLSLKWLLLILHRVAYFKTIGVEQFISQQEKDIITTMDASISLYQISKITEEYKLILSSINANARLSSSMVFKSIVKRIIGLIKR